MNERQEHPRPIRTLRQHFWQGLAAVHRRRPASFYLLLSIPVVLVLAVNLFEPVDNPRRLAFGLSILFIFFGVVLIRACRDILQLTRELVVQHRRTYKETLGDEAFLETLRANRPNRDGDDSA